MVVGLGFGLALITGSAAFADSADREHGHQAVKDRHHKHVQENKQHGRPTVHRDHTRDRRPVATRAHGTAERRSTATLGTAATTNRQAARTGAQRRALHDATANRAALLAAHQRANQAAMHQRQRATSAAGHQHAALNAATARAFTRLAGQQTTTQRRAAPNTTTGRTISGAAVQRAAYGRAVHAQANHRRSADIRRHPDGRRHMRFHYADRPEMRARHHEGDRERHHDGDRPHDHARHHDMQNRHHDGHDGQGRHHEGQRDAFGRHHDSHDRRHDLPNGHHHDHGRQHDMRGDHDGHRGHHDGPRNTPGRHHDSHDRQHDLRNGHHDADGRRNGHHEAHGRHHDAHGRHHDHPVAHHGHANAHAHHAAHHAVHHGTHHARPAAHQRHQRPRRPEVMKFGDKSHQIRAMKQRLRQLGFDSGVDDGRYGETTRYAVWAFQKVNGLRMTNRIDRDTMWALHHPRRVKPLVRPKLTNRVEIDVRRQLMTIWRDGKPDLTTHISTGANRSYCDNGHCGFARTPAGDFRAGTRAPGWTTSPLGTMFNSIYFNGGIAMHGSSEVPKYPASHGCIRIPIHTSKIIYAMVTAGEPVHVRGAQSKYT